MFLKPKTREQAIVPPGVLVGLVSMEGPLQIKFSLLLSPGAPAGWTHVSGIFPSVAASGLHFLKTWMIHVGFWHLREAYCRNTR